MSTIAIRQGLKSDLPSVLALIRELAVFEKAPFEVELTIEELENDGFSDKPVFNFFVAEMDNSIVGMALYYVKYSTWKGKCLFLEDLIVTESARRKGIGAMLFEKIIDIAKHLKLRRLEWQVLDWNEPAINFYKKYNANLDPEWLNGKLIYQQLQAFESSNNL